MKKMNLAIVALIMLSLNTFASVKDFTLGDEALNDLLKASTAINAIPDVKIEQIDSVIDIFKSLKHVSQTDLKEVIAFITPQLNNTVNSNVAGYKKCLPIAKSYNDKLGEDYFKLLAEKYKYEYNSNIRENMQTFFQVYLLQGLTENAKLDMLENAEKEESSDSKIDDYFVAAKDNSIDEMIYFIMAHAYKPLLKQLTDRY